MAVTGRMRRGFCFRQVCLTDNEREFLLSLKRDPSKVDQRYVKFPRVVWANRCNFVLRQDNEFLIHFRRPGYGTSWPLIGYVNLDEASPKLQFRGSLLTHGLIPMSQLLVVLLDPDSARFMLIMFLVVLLILTINHWVVTTSIRSQLRDHSTAPG